MLPTLVVLLGPALPGGASGQLPTATGNGAGGGGATEHRDLPPFVWFLHFHKAAGTAFCGLALANGLKLAPYESDIHGHLELGEGRLDMRDVDSILAGLHGLRRRGVGFGSTEHWFPAPVVFAELRERSRPWLKFVAVLRDPVSRTISSFGYHNHGGRRCGKIACATIEAYAEAEANLMTRMLAGMVFAPGRKVQKDLDIAGLGVDQSATALRAQAAAVRRSGTALVDAKRVLRSFDVVLIQERLAEPRSLSLLRAKLGWQRTTLPHIVLKATGNGSHLVGAATTLPAWRRAAAAAHSDAAATTIRRMNALDGELYRWADAQFTDDPQPGEL